MLQIKYIIVMEHTAIMAETYPADLTPEASVIRVEMVHGKVEKATHIPPPDFEDYSSLEERVCAHLAKGGEAMAKGVEMHRQLARKDMFKRYGTRYSGRSLSDEERKRRDDFYRNMS